MPRRRSLALDEAAAAEMRRAAGIDTPEEGEGGREDEADKEVEEASAVATGLRSKYAAKETSTAKKGRKKKEEEVGPSGMTYTPLEKQFMEIKAKWPDVLLMMEGALAVVASLT